MTSKGRPVEIIDPSSAGCDTESDQFTFNNYLVGFLSFELLVIFLTLTLEKWDERIN